MSFSLHFNHCHRLKFQQSLSLASSFLRDYPQSIGSLFPGLETFKRVDPSKDIFRWIFYPLQYAGKFFTIDFQTQFEKQDNEIMITPIADKSNASLTGNFKLIKDNNVNHLLLNFDLTLTVPLPVLTKGVVSRFAEKEMESLFYEYDKRLEKALN